MDPGERVMRSEFLSGNPEEADEEVGVKMRGELEEKRRNTYGRGKSFTGWRIILFPQDFRLHHTLFPSDSDQQSTLGDCSRHIVLGFKKPGMLSSYWST